MVDAGPWPPSHGAQLPGPYRTSRYPASDRPRSPVAAAPRDMYFDDEEGLAYGFDDEPSLSELMMADSADSADLGTPDADGHRRGSIPMRPQPQQPSPPRHELRQKPRSSNFGHRELNHDTNHAANATKPGSRGKSSRAELEDDFYSARRRSVHTSPPHIVASGVGDYDGDEDDGAGMVDIDPTQLPQHPDESQQDLAERINQLTRTINANAQLCLETSRKMVALAQENKHLAYEAGAQLDTYVLQPALKLGQALRTYCPGVDEGVQALWEYEAQIRKRVVNGLNGRDSLFQPGGGGRQGKEVDRLKDRLIEQDALLRDSSQHIRKLMSERDRLRRKLETGYNTQDDDGGARRRESPGYRDLDDIVRQAQDGSPPPTSRASHQRAASHTEDAQLAEQLGELRVLVDRLPVLHDVPSSSDTKARHGASTSTQAGNDEDDDWTLL
ncbi:hypothetical protein Micbo1qcDRAFT_229834 [Microdochium bolleyi]|uniref:Uncharacterized protein n=1 Tax=Microdochium bolleyi TaxID=196109 RepID=A0A136JIV7_9PEZI|nr:hypothetical protein Micbo1qcDRAFT_229834 [Microdochium bolleyi]